MELLSADPLALDGPCAGVVLDALGGTSVVAGLTFTPTSTVDSWRKNGISKARFDHVRLAAHVRGKGPEFAAAITEITKEPILPFDTEGPTP